MFEHPNNVLKSIVVRFKHVGKISMLETILERRCYFNVG